MDAAIVLTAWLRLDPTACCRAPTLQEHMVCVEEVSERVKRRRDEPFDAEQRIAEIVAQAEDKRRRGIKGKRKAHEINFDSSSDDSDSDDDGVQIGPHGNFLPRRNRVNTRCWYISPRYFVDVVRYRLHLMKKHLEALESYQGSEAMFKCSNARCSYECTMLEAEQRRAAELTHSAALASGRAGGLGIGIGTVRDAMYAGGATTNTTTAASSSGSAFVYKCALCGSMLAARQVESVARAAGRLLTKFSDQLRSTGLLTLLKQLDSVSLGANRPSDNIKAGIITLHGPDGAVAAADAAAQNGDGNGGSGDAGSSSGAGGGAGGKGSGFSAVADLPAASNRVGAATAGGRVYMKNQQKIIVKLEGDEEEEGSKEGGQSSGAGGRAPMPAAAAVAASVLPSHLTKSSITGESTRTFGFLQVAGAGAEEEPMHHGDDEPDAGSGSSAAAAAGPASAASSLLFTSSLRAPSGLGAGSGVSALTDAAAASQLGGAGAGAGGEEEAYDTNINAGYGDADASSAAAQHGDISASGAAAEVSNDALWQMLFAQLVTQGGASGGGSGAAEVNQAPAPAASAAAAAAATQPADEDEEEWDDV